MPTPTRRMEELAEIARRAGEIAVSFHAGIGRELKPDGSIVTAGDRAVETMLREELVKFAPGSTVWGEEFGFEVPGPGGLWVVDPIDGTSNYAFGSPLWGVSIALIQGDEIELGAVALPELGEMYLGERGGGAFRNGVPLPAIAPGTIRPEELISTSDHFIINRGRDFPGKARILGAFVVDGAFTLSQRFRGLIGMRERLYDVAACVLMAKELGADVRYLDGGPFEIAPLMQPKSIDRPWMIFPRDSGYFLPDKT